MKRECRLARARAATYEQTLSTRQQACRMECDVRGASEDDFLGDVGFKGRNQLLNRAPGDTGLIMKYVDQPIDLNNVECIVGLVGNAAGLTLGLAGLFGVTVPWIPNQRCR